MSILLPFLALLLVAGIAAYHRFTLAVFTALAASVLVAMAMAGANITATIVAGVILALVTLPIRSHSPAPIFCATMVDTAAPTAIAGIWR